MALPRTDEALLKRVEQPRVQPDGLELGPGLAWQDTDRSLNANVGIAERTLPRLICLKV